MKKPWNKIHFLPISMIIIGIGSTLLSSLVAKHYVEFLGLLLALVLASLLVGVVLGFLFGIPKLNDKFNPSEDYEQKLKYKPNTNLEDISDWLTKIIVGVSLTQALKIPRYLDQLSQFILKNSDCATHCNYAQAIVISEIIFFIITGFIIGYFYTRLYLPGLFSLMEEYKKQTAEIKIWKEGYNKSFDRNDVSNSFDNKSKGINLDLTFLTEDETNLLQEIANADNNYVITKTLTYKEQAACNVLIDKNIIKIKQGSTLQTGATLTIVEDRIFNDLKNDNNIIKE